MFSLTLATFLLQWATGGLLFLWVTTRHRAVAPGYGWILRGIYGTIALAAAASAVLWTGQWVLAASALGVVISCVFATAVSVSRRSAGVANRMSDHTGRAPWFLRLFGFGRDRRAISGVGAEFDPKLDLLAPAVGAVGLLAAGFDAADGGTNGPVLLSILRVALGAALLGAAFDGIILGHWFVAQPGLDRRYLGEMNRSVGYLVVPHILSFLWGPGMLSVLNGSIDDGFGGMMGWFWVACAITTIALVIVTYWVLAEPSDSAVMAAMGLLHIVGLTAFGTDLVARAVLAAT